MLQSDIPGYGEYRYGYQGENAEEDEETGWNYFEARMYDPVIGRWLSVDPEGQYPSPYLGMGNDPISRIDPDGKADNPIYTSEGEFRGVDNKGLQGDPIIYDGDFSVGMSQKKILNNGGNFLHNYDFGDNYMAMTNIMLHWSKLPSRPDWDGYLTFSEVTKWSNEGSGEPLYVDASKLDLYPTTVSDVQFAAKNQGGYINYFGKANWNTGVVYGNIKVTLLDPNTGNVRLGNKNRLLDEHNFSNQIFKYINDSLYPGNPNDFNIYCYDCTNTVPKQRFRFH